MDCFGRVEEDPAYAVEGGVEPGALLGGDLAAMLGLFEQAAVFPQQRLQVGHVGDAELILGFDLVCLAEDADPGAVALDDLK